MRIRLLSSLAVAVSLAALACQSTDVAAPASPMSARLDSSRRDEAWDSGHSDEEHGQPAKVVACSSRRTASGSGEFGPNGGTLVFGDSRLIIPGGALRTTVTITAVPRNDGTSTVDFQPEGLQFRRPAGLVLSADGCTLPDEGMPSIVYLGLDGGIQETIPARYEPRWKTVAAPIEHFSGYAIAF